MDQFKYENKGQALEDLQAFSDMHMSQGRPLFLVQTYDYWMIMSKHVPDDSEVQAIAYRGVVYTRDK